MAAFVLAEMGLTFAGSHCHKADNLTYNRVSAKLNVMQVILATTTA